MHQIEAGQKQDGRVNNSAPAEYLWKPGQSGNPDGRRKNHAISEALCHLILTPCEGNEKLKLPKKHIAAHRIAMTMITRAIAGDISAANAIIDRLEGKASQHVDVSGQVSLVQIILEATRRESPIIGESSSQGAISAQPTESIKIIDGEAVSVLPNGK